MSTFKLYSTAGCHLCEIAEVQLGKLGYLAETQKVDIVGDELLVRDYGDKIPVLEHVISQEKLYWPFTPAQIQQLLES
ncbi:glutaredoxin family protein [Algicola sagamiensis]|uniref:glutaredoxin family protein n=1 Tax=Algicola sagamiensis TaxID=163869 RepID=UPI000361BFE0|nr:glutaredoxin family protein [Algicola sagamiensis]